MAKRQAKSERTSERTGEGTQAAPVQARPDVPGWGVDLDPRNRPGVPFHRPPARVGEAHWDEPERQPVPAHLVRMELPRSTPVFGTAQPPTGVAGAIRRVAYRFPEHRARRWMLLLAADRIEAYGPRLAAGVVLGGAALALWRRGRPAYLEPRRRPALRYRPSL